MRLAKGKKLGPLHGAADDHQGQSSISPACPRPGACRSSGIIVPASNALAVQRLHRCRRHRLRQDQRAGLPRSTGRRYNDDLRHDQQSLGPVARAGRLVGRLGGGAGGRSHRARSRQSTSAAAIRNVGALLRRLRTQADLRRHQLRRACHCPASCATSRTSPSLGPLARSADDLELALTLIAGPDRRSTRVAWRLALAAAAQQTAPRASRSP